MIKLVAFDWNGTLLSDAVACWESNNNTIKILGGKPTTFSYYRDHNTVPISKYYVGLGLDEGLILKNSERIAKIWHAYYEKRVSKTRTRANARFTLDALAKNNTRTLIFSNHTVEGIALQLKRLKIENYFETVIANDKLDAAIKARGKKQKLENYIKVKGVKPQEVLVVGDTTEEIEIARDFGGISVAITHGYDSTPRLKKAGPDYLINDLKELIPIIKNLNGR